MPDLQPMLTLFGRLLPFPGMEQGFMQRAAVALILLAPSAATMGIQVVTFRMAFFSDAIGHSVFLGIALGLWLAIDPRLSMLLLGFVVAVGVTAYLRRSSLSSDAVIGVVFSAVMAAGLALMSRYRSMGSEIQRYVYGDVLTVTNEDLWLLLGMFVAVAVYQVLYYNRSMAVGVSTAVAQVHGVRVDVLQHTFAVLVALVVMLSVRTVGVFLVTAMLIVPASAARNFARSAGGMFWCAQLVSLSSALGGLYLSTLPEVGTATGATVVLAAFAWFVLSTIVARLRGRAYR